MKTHSAARFLTITTVILLLSSLLTACRPYIGGSGLRSVHEAEIQLPVIVQQPAAEQQAAEPSPIPTEPAAALPEPTASPAPLRFTLPTPEAAPVSLWRPALYRTPWALGPYDHFFFARPIAADEVNWPLADYRYGGIFPGTTSVVHTGIDIDAPMYTPVLAAAKGTVVWADFGLFSGAPNPDDPYGLAVAIRHDFGWNGQRLYTIYAHMDKILVTTGQELEAGEQLGVVGVTGNTTGPHLHFEVRIKNNNFFTTLNPELWLAPPVGWGVLVGQIRNTNGSMLDAQDVTVKSLDTGRKWVVRSYGNAVVNPDSYYDENVVLSDLPAGNYEIIIDYLKDRYTLQTAINPGAITYFTFQGKNGFGTELPAPPTPEDWAQLTPQPGS